MADNPDCGYSGGSLAGAIIGTFVATLVLLGLIYLVWEWQKKRRIKKSGLHNLVIVEDGGGGTANGSDSKGFGYDNPGFVDESSDSKKSQQGRGLDAKFNNAGKPQNGGKKMPWGPLSFLFKSRNALDDSVIEEPQKYTVALKGHDFTGLGFNICGNMRDGIFVKDIMQRGPAAESKQILPGDQITGMTVSFKQMVLEDAITLLSYASPYEVTFEMLRLSEKSLPHKGIFVSSPTHQSASAGQSNTLERVCHPFFKSQSIDDLRKVGKEHLDLQVDRKKKQANGIHASKTSSSPGSSTTTTTSSPPAAGGTMEIPTVIVVGNNENRSSSPASSSSPSKGISSTVKMPKMPKMNFSMGSSSPKSSNAPEAHQKSSSSSQIQIPMPDEVDAPRGAIVSVKKPEIVPRTKTKSTHVQKTSDMELVEAISPAIDKMTAELKKGKMEIKEGTDKATASASAVLEVKPVEIDMSGQPSVKIEKEMKVPDMKIQLDTSEVDIRTPSMTMMGAGGSGNTKEDKKKDKTKEKKEKKEKANEKKEKANAKKEKASKDKKSGLDIDLTPPKLSLNAGIELEGNEKEAKAGKDQEESKKSQKGQKSKDKTEKTKEKDGKKEKPEKEKDKKEKEDGGAAGAVEPKEHGESSGEKSKFFKFGIPDLSFNLGFGGSKSSGDDKDKEKDNQDKAVKEVEVSVVEKLDVSTQKVATPKEPDTEKKDKVLELSFGAPSYGLAPPDAMKDDKEKKEKEEKEKEKKEKEKKEKEEKEKKEKEKKEKEEKEKKEKEKKEKEEKERKEKEAKEKSKKDKGKDKEKEMEEKEVSKAEKTDNNGQQGESSQPQKEKSGSGFSFNIKLPSFEKPLLKRKDSSSSTSGDTTTAFAVDSSPNASGKDADSKAKKDEKVEKPAPESSPAKSKKKGKSKEKSSSRPTSPEISEGHRTTDDEADRPIDLIDSIPGEKSRKGSGFHMPHIGIKLPKFGGSKQTYSFENVGEKDLKHGHGPTAESLLDPSPSVKMETSGNTAEFKKMTPTKEDILPDVTVKMDQPIVQIEKPVVEMIKKTKDEVDSSEVKVDIVAPKVSLQTESVEIPSTSIKVEGVTKESSSVTSESEGKGETVMAKPEDDINKDSQKESKPSFVSKGLKGLRDFKDKVAHKLSHDHQPASSSSSDEEGEPGDDKMKVKKEKKTKESREKSKEEKQKEKEEKAKEKERVKAEKKAKKLELKKKLSATAAHNSSSSSSSSSSSDESDAEDGKKENKKENKKSKTNKDKKGKKDKKGEKSDKKSPLSAGIEVKAEIPGIEVQAPEIVASSTIEQKQVSGHEAKLIPAKPPVVPRKSKEESVKAAAEEANVEMAAPSKPKVKKSKSKGGASSSSSSSGSSDSDGDDKEGKPKKPKRTQKRKAPEVPTPSATVDVPDIVKITTSAEVISPPKEETMKKESGEMKESTSKTPESGRRSASFGDLSSLQQPKSKDGPLERAMSMDMAGDQDNNEPGAIPHGSSLEDLSVLPDSKTITHLTRGQHQLHGVRDSITSKSSTSSNETLKESSTSVVQVHPKGLQSLNAEVSDVSHIAPSATINVTSTSSQAVSESSDPQSSTIQKMMNETLSVMNNIVHEMDSPSLVKSAMNAASSSSGQQGKGGIQSSQVIVSTSGTSPAPLSDDKVEAERVAQQTVDEIMVKASQSLMKPEMSVTVNNAEHPDVDDGPRVSVTTGDNTNATGTTISDLAHSLSADMEGGADSFSIASVKIQGMDGDTEEPVSVRNITVTNIKSEPKPANEDNVTIQASGTGVDADGAKLMREDSKARLLQTVADANEIKVAPATPLRNTSSLSSSSCSVDSSSDIRPDDGGVVLRPNFSLENIASTSSGRNTNGQTIEISSEELDGIMMSHADFLQKQSTVEPALAQEDSLEEPDHLNPQQIKDTFDNWVYVEQKNAAHEHTCPHSHSDPEPSTASSNDDDDGPYSRNGALSPTTYRMETEYKFETSEMRVTSSPIPPADAHVKSQSTVYSTTMTLPQKTVTQITLGDPVIDSNGGRIVSKITLDTSSETAEDSANKGAAGNNAELPNLESLK